MTLLTGLVVTLVVWAVSLVRSVPLRALVYSLPVPITLVLVTTRIPVDARHLVGVVLLNVFVAAVAWLHHGLRWPILLADLAGVAVYVAGSWALLRSGPLPFVPVLVATVGLWLLLAALRPPRPAAGAAGRHAVPRLGKLLVLAAGALLMVGLGGLLAGMVVTFPYSGVLVVVETRRDLVEFRAHFARNSLALLAFFAAYFVVQGVSRVAAVVVAWAAFACCALLLQVTRPHAWRDPGMSTRAGVD
jgi:hypothetical protein